MIAQFLVPVYLASSLVSIAAPSLSSTFLSLLSHPFLTAELPAGAVNRLQTLPQEGQMKLCSVLPCPQKLSH